MVGEDLSLVLREGGGRGKFTSLSPASFSVAPASAEMPRGIYET